MKFFKYILVLFLCISFISTSLFAKKSIVLISSEKEPYIGSNLPNQGYVYEVVNESFKEVGYDIKIIYAPLIRAQNIAKKGLVDGLIPSYNTKGPSQRDFVFSLPFPGDYIGLLKKKSLKIENLEENISNPQKLYKLLENYRFGIVRGVYGLPVFDYAEYLDKSFVSKDIQNIDKLFLDRLDFVIIDKFVASDIIVNQRPNMIGKLEFVTPPLISNTFHVAFSKNAVNYEEKLKDFNTGLELLRKKGKIDKILANHGLLQTKSENKTKLVIGSVNNSEMLVMKELSKLYEKEHPNIELEWRILEETTLRKRLLSDMAISDGQFDIMTIGAYETQIWAKEKWLSPIKDLPKKYDLDDIIKPLRDNLSFKNNLYALPFYAESSMTFYRTDLFKKAGITMPENPTYKDILNFIKKIHDPENGVYGICLRGKAGWGANMAFFNTLLNSFGGRWFDENWNPTINTLEWENALSLFKELIVNYAPPGTSTYNFNENKELFSEGHCGIWIDATVAAGLLFDPNNSKVYKDIGYAKAPIAVTENGSHWLWTWSLAIPSSSKQKKDALDFITWATSKDYINLVAKKSGWLQVPPGTRTSTYENKNYKKEAKFSNFVFNSINNIDTKNNTLYKSPYDGILYVEIPEYPSLGDNVGSLIQQVIEENITINDALKEANEFVKNQMLRSGYLKK